MKEFGFFLVLIIGLVGVAILVISNGLLHQPIHITIDYIFPIFERSSTVLYLSEPDSFLLYDYPSISLLNAYNFTIELYYKTPPQPNIKKNVAIFSNLRSAEDVYRLYGRWFSLYMHHNGTICLDYSAGDWRGDQNTHGLKCTLHKYDDDQWHHLAVVRNRSNQIVMLYMDFQIQFILHMPTGIDVQDQEQRTIFGGGNDRAFRACMLDEIKIWKIALEDGSMMKRNHCDMLKVVEHHDLISYYSFEDDFNSSAIVRDMGPRRMHALRIGQSQNNSALVIDGGLPMKETCSRELISKTRKKYEKFYRNGPRTEIIFLSSLMYCPKCWYETVRLHINKSAETCPMYLFEAYFGFYWLDMIRFNLFAIVFISDDSDKMELLDKLKIYKSYHMQFLLVDEYDLQRNQKQAIPKDCLPVNSRFIHMEYFIGQNLACQELEISRDESRIIFSSVFEYAIYSYLKNNQKLENDGFECLSLERKWNHILIDEQPKWLIHSDMRDFRIVHDPIQAIVKTNKTTSIQLLFQSGARSPSLISGGFQAGNRYSLFLLFHLLATIYRSDKCEGLDQGWLQHSWQNNKIKQMMQEALASVNQSWSLDVDLNIINSQQTRRFDDSLVFLHGNWWPSKRTGQTPQGYILGVP